MQRRNFLSGAAMAMLARPAIGGGAKTLIFVPQSPLASLDPVWTSAMTTRNVGFMIYDVLFGRDAAMNPKPQMLAGYVVEDDGRRWVMTLRENLWFHDGTKVLARDCTASLRRWMKRDPGGATLEARLDALEAPDDRTIVLRLNKRFPALPKLLSKFQTAAVMVPERIATGTDPFKQMTEIVGSGPFRFLKDEYVIGSHAALVPFERYSPRDEPASFTSGGHRVLVDRVEWKMIPDPATAANALVTGEVDWLEMPMPDLLPMLRRASNVVTGRLDQWGFISQLRPNHVAAPTNNVKLRRAIMAAIDQHAVMEAIMGGDPEGVTCRWVISPPASPTWTWRRHRGADDTSQCRRGEGDAGGGRLFRRTAGDAAHHRPAVLQLGVAGGGGCTVARRHQRSTTRRWTGARCCSAVPAGSRWTRAAGRCSSA